MMLVVRKQERRSLVSETLDLPSWLTYDLENHGFSKVGYLAPLLKDHPAVLSSRELGVIDLSRLGEEGIDLGPLVLRALNMEAGSGFVWSRDPEYARNDRWVVGELENAVFGVYLRSGDPGLLRTLDRALGWLHLVHTDRWTIYLERARREFARRRVTTGETELTLDEPLPISLRTVGEPDKGPLLRLVASLVHGYLGYLPEGVQEQLMETGCAFVPNMRLLLKQFPQLARDQNVLKLDFFSRNGGRSRGNRSARKLLGLEPGNGWILIRDARRHIEHNLSEALKDRFTENVRALHHRAPSTVEKVQLSTLLNEHGVGCTFDRDNRRSRKVGWTTGAGGSERQVLGAAALDHLGWRREREAERPAR